MAKVIPAIIAKDFKELEQKIKKTEDYFDWIQIDIMDGLFVDNITWNNPLDLKKINTKAKLEAHLMLDKPEDFIDSWIESGVSRIIFHFEATEDHQKIINQIKSAGLEAGLAVNPDTPIESVYSFADSLKMLLVMGVNPGFSGQDFKEETILKIKKIRNNFNDLIIGLDGGVNFNNSSKVIKA